ncbi:unnamed protein product [Phaeothamnion confervicola]
MDTTSVVNPSTPPPEKKRCVEGAVGAASSGDPSGGATFFAGLPSTEELQSRGLETKAEMATAGNQWAITDLAAWRRKALTTPEGAEFVALKQRELRRGLLQSPKKEKQL